MNQLTELIDEKLKIAEMATKGEWEFQDSKSNQFVIAVVEKSMRGREHDKIKQICALPGFASKEKDFKFIASTRDGQLDYEQCLRALKVAVEALQADTGKTINDQNAAEMFHQMTLRHAQALEEINAIARGEK